MTKKLHYKLTISVEEDADVEGLQEELQDVLGELYDGFGVSSIKLVKDGYTEQLSNLESVFDNLDNVETERLMLALEMLERLEHIDDRNT